MGLAHRWQLTVKFVCVGIGGSIAALAACSVANAPDHPVEPGAGGSNNMTTTTGGSGGGDPCDGGLIDCSNDGVCETDPLTTVEHCGGCNQSCLDQLANVTGHACSAGTCSFAGCGALAEDCDNDPSNGCEKLDDLQNCGSCGGTCTPLNVTTATCAGGSCGFDSCSGTFDNCDNDASNGCETDVMANDALNCGSCNNQCYFGCVAGECEKVVFVTSQLYAGNLGGLTGADAICQSHANAAGLPGSYMAWLSDATGSPTTRFTPSNAPYRRIDGIIVATNWTDLLDGNLNAPIVVTELGGLALMNPNHGCASTTPAVWSNTTTNGTQVGGGLSCNNWTASSVFQSAWGRADQASSLWTSWCTGGNNDACGWASSLYCFQQ
jgi:hypothetical protein